MPAIDELNELNEDQVVELLENDPESERLLGRVEAALENLREIAGMTNGDNAKVPAER
jgi:hypothetical protein